MGKKLEDFGRQSKGEFYLNLALSSADPSKQFEKPKKPFIVTHIPRTAGTTLDSIIRAVSGSSGAVFRRALGSIYGQYLGSDKDDAAGSILKKERPDDKIHYMIGHIPFGIHRRLGLEDATYTVVLRDPILRLFSQIKLGYPTQAAFGAKEINAVIDGNKIVDNSQVRIIAGCFDPEEKCDDKMLRTAIDNLKTRYTYVGFQEHFQRLLHQVIEGEQWPSILYFRKHQSPYTEIELTEPSSKKLAPFLHLDNLLYEEAKNTFGFSKMGIQAPVLVNTQTIQTESQADIIFNVHPHQLMGIQSGTLPHRLIQGAMERLEKNGLPVYRV